MLLFFKWVGTANAIGARGFIVYEAREQAPRQAGWVLRQIGHLYLIEKYLRESHRGGSGPALRDAVRAAQSRPIIKRIHAAIVRLNGSKRHLPQSLMGKAMAYALNQWSTLTLYAKGGHVEPSGAR